MTEIKKEISELTIKTSTPEPEQRPKIITYTDFKVISTEKKGRVTTALTVKLSAVSPNSPVVENEKNDGDDKNEDNICPIPRNVIKLDLTNKRHPKYIPSVAISSNGRVSPGLLADPGEELLIQKIIQNHKKYSRDYLMALRESKKALQLPVGLPNIPDLLPTSKQVVIVQTNSNAGPHKSNHHKQGHHHHNNNNHNNNYHHQNNQSGNQGGGNHHHHHHGQSHQNNQHHNTGYHHSPNNQNNNNYHNNRRNTVGAIHNNHHGQNANNYQNNNYGKYYNNQHHNNHFNQNYNKNKHVHNNNSNNNNNNTNQG